MQIPHPMGLSLASDVKRHIIESSAVDHILNWAFHCSTETPELQRTKQRFLTVQHAVTPGSGEQMLNPIRARRVPRGVPSMREVAFALTQWTQ